MANLPSEIWSQILDYLDPTEILAVQRVSRKLLKLGRDPQLWKSKVFEKAPSAAHAFASGGGLTDLLNSLSLNGSSSNQTTESAGQSEIRLSRRAKAMVKWDCTDRSERVDWYSEYIARHAELSTEWTRHTPGNEIRSMYLFDSERKVLSAMEDGSLRVWDVRHADNGRRTLNELYRTRPALLFDDFRSNEGSSSLSKAMNVGTAIDNTLVHLSGDKAYVAVDDILNEVDLNQMRVVSQQKYAWNITALSQQSGSDLPLMIGTSFTLNMHDPRTPLEVETASADSKLDNFDMDNSKTAFLPNYAKKWIGNQPHPTRPPRWLHSSRFDANGSTFLNIETEKRSLYSIPTRPRTTPEIFASVEPGPQAILHRGVNEILVAGRMPSILFYDKRTFPRLQSVIHSGARLSSMTILPYKPHHSLSSTAEATLVAAGEYHGRGSLELYELPSHRPSDLQASYNWPPEEEESPSPDIDSDNTVSHLADPDQEPSATESTPLSKIDRETPFSHKNRQTSSAAKLLSVAAQGARIVFSDSEGGIKWVERDGVGVARRWNINKFEYTRAGGAVIGDSVARKIVAFASDQQHGSFDAGPSCMTRGDGDLLFWTGSDIGIITSQVGWADHDGLVAAFEKQMTLNDSTSAEGATRKSQEEQRMQEEEYARTMRRALERQADERRFLARFGRTGMW